MTHSTETNRNSEHQFTLDIVIVATKYIPVGEHQIGRIHDLVLDLLQGGSGVKKKVRVPKGDSNAMSLQPAVPIEKSVTPDVIYCLEDGMPFKMLKRHLKRSYNLTPEEYRRKWNLPHDYPMVAPRYKALKRAEALRMGLGRRGSDQLS